MWRWFYHQIEELKLVPEQAAKACEDLKKQLENLEKAKVKEEKNEKEVMDSLKDETKVRKWFCHEKNTQIINYSKDYCYSFLILKDFCLSLLNLVFRLFIS